MLKSIKWLAMPLMATSVALSVQNAAAAEVTGAGATFPAPIYAKWADAYKKATGDEHELPVDRLGRRHQADQGQDRRFRRVRHAAEAPKTSTRTA